MCFLKRSIKHFEKVDQTALQTKVVLLTHSHMGCKCWFKIEVLTFAFDEISNNIDMLLSQNQLKSIWLIAPKMIVFEISNQKLRHSMVSDLLLWKIIKFKCFH